jgi:vancomycin permeability regulator SanA
MSATGFELDVLANTFICQTSKEHIARLNSLLDVKLPDRCPQIKGPPELIRCPSIAGVMFRDTRMHLRTRTKSQNRKTARTQFPQ